MELEILSGLTGRKYRLWQALLQNAGLTPDSAIEQTVLLWDGETLAAAGSRQGNLLKCIAVEEHRQGDGLTATILTALRQEAFREGQSHLFLYTKPEHQFRFSSLFFYPVARTGQVLLMENRKNGIGRFLEELPVCHTQGAVGAIVMNCDPFTRGHRYLAQTAAAECAHVYIFVLSEEKGYFSARDRLEMVRLGTADLPNVTVLPTGPYLISSATFPTYFLKNRDEAGQVHCQLDIQIFLQHFAPYFHITRRYVGTEPLSPVTNRYNEILKQQLPSQGIDVRELPRLMLDGVPVSAGTVRTLLQNGDWQALQALVPHTTLDYLKKIFLPQQEVRP